MTFLTLYFPWKKGWLKNKPPFYVTSSDFKLRLSSVQKELAYLFSVAAEQ